MHDDETMVAAIPKPMTVEEMLRCADALFNGTKLAHAFACFVPFSPPILRAMVGNEAKYQPCRVEPYTHGGKLGSLVVTQHKEVFDTYYARFHGPKRGQGEDDGKG